MHERLLIHFLMTLATCSLTTMDPCNNTTMTNVLSDDRRDKRTTSSLLCDARLQQGWYKFEDSSGTPLTIPVANCIDANKCGTVVPLFIKDVANTGRTPSPGDGAVERTVCGNFFTCCFFSYNICLRKCTATGPTFYYLKPPPGCNLAYCTGKVIIMQPVVSLLFTGVSINRRRTSWLSIRTNS